jgi:DNA helicase-2/ATP-dependent DNA helicase PcrA
LGLSQFANIKIFNDTQDPRQAGKHYKIDLPEPEGKPIDFGVGDTVNQARYGNGKVIDIAPAGADYEVTIEFEGVGQKKFMAHLSKLKKV